MIQIATIISLVFHMKQSLDIKSKARLVGSNVNLPTSLFLWSFWQTAAARRKSEPTLPTF